MTDTLGRIGMGAFKHCKRLTFVKLSRNLEYIGTHGFLKCESLESIFIPPSCQVIDFSAFEDCRQLVLFHVHHNTVLGEGAFEGTLLIIDKSPFEKLPNGRYPIFDDIGDWIKSINSGRKCTLYRICCSTFENEALPISEAIYEVVKEQGPQMLQVENKIGITPLQYLAENPYLENIDEMKMLRRYMLEMIT